MTKDVIIYNPRNDKPAGSQFNSISRAHDLTQKQLEKVNNLVACVNKYQMDQDIECGKLTENYGAQ